MRTSTERDVMFLDIIIGSDPAYIAPFPIGELIQKLIVLKEEEPNATAKWYKKNNRKVFIRDLAVMEGSSVCLLLYDTDADAPGASFADLDTDVQRDEAKKDREGRPESAHLVIKTTPGDETSTYLALLEESSRLNRSHVERYLNGLLGDISKRWKGEFKVPHPDGSITTDGGPHMQSYRPRLEMLGHLSADFQKDLETGKLRGISLETSRVATASPGLGEPRSVQVTRRDIKLRPRGSWRDHPMSKIRDAIGIGRESSYETARIVFETQDGTSHTALMDTATGDLLNDGYVRRYRLTSFDHLLLEATSSIDPQVNGKMHSLLY